MWLPRCRYMWPLLSPYRFAFYHSFHPLSSIIWGALIDFVVVSVLATVFFFYFEKRGNIYRSLIWVLVAARLVAQIQKVHLSTSWPALRLWKSAAPLVLSLLAALALWRLLPRTYEALAKGFAILLALAGLNALWIVPELLYLGLRHKVVDPVLAHSLPTDDRAAKSASSEHRPRIVWLLFDELSYDQTFEHRFPGLAMPAFDQLRGKSFLFQDVQPAGYLHRNSRCPLSSWVGLWMTSGATWMAERYSSSPDKRAGAYWIHRQRCLEMQNGTAGQPDSLAGGTLIAVSCRIRSIPATGRRMSRMGFLARRTLRWRMP